MNRQDASKDALESKNEKRPQQKSDKSNDKKVTCSQHIIDTLKQADQALNYLDFGIKFSYGTLRNEMSKHVRHERVLTLPKECPARFILPEWAHRPEYSCVIRNDKKGRVGIGLGKASEVADAIRRGGEMARGDMVSVSLNGPTIPHEVYAHYDGAKILLRPASPGTGIIAGKTVRSVLESAGIKDILSKSLGSKNAANVVKATLNALLSLRLREAILKARGLEVKKAEPAAAAA